MRRAIATALLVIACGDDGGAGNPPDAAAPGADAAAGADVMPGAGEWTALPDLAGGPRQETAVAALGGQVYVIGGFDETLAIVAAVEAYDPAIAEWTARAPVPDALHHGNAAVVGDTLFLLGSLRTAGFEANGEGWSYTQAANAWTPIAPMPVGSERGASGVAVVGGKIYVAGGSRGGSVADFTVYDPGTDEWTVLAPLPEPRDHLVGGGVGDVAYFIGGRLGGIAGVSGKVFAYDTVAGSWSEVAPMITPRGGAAAGVQGGTIFVAGGEGNAADPSGVFPEFEGFDAQAGVWLSFAPMLTPRHGMGGAVVGPSFYVPGGATVQGYGAVATVEMFTP